MNALIFVHKLWSDHEPLLRDELTRSSAMSSRIKVNRHRCRSEIRITDAEAARADHSATAPSAQSDDSDKGDELG